MYFCAENSCDFQSCLKFDILNMGYLVQIVQSKHTYVLSHHIFHVIHLLSNFWDLIRVILARIREQRLVRK